MYLTYLPYPTYLHARARKRERERERDTSNIIRLPRQNTRSIRSRRNRGQKHTKISHSDVFHEADEAETYTCKKEFQSVNRGLPQEEKRKKKEKGGKKRDEKNKQHTNPHSHTIPQYKRRSHSPLIRIIRFNPRHTRRGQIGWSDQTLRDGSAQAHSFVED